MKAFRKVVVKECGEVDVVFVFIKLSDDNRTASSSRPQILPIKLFDQAAETALVHLTTSSTIQNLLSRVVAVTTNNLVAGVIAKDLEQSNHDEAAGNTHAENTNHDKVAVAVAVPSRGRVLGPASVQGVCRDNASKVAQARYQGGSSSNTNFAVTLLEDLVGPGHANGNRGTEAKSDEQQTAVSAPLVVQSKGHSEQPGDLNTNGRREEKGAVLVEPIRNRGDEENSDQVHLCLC